MFRIVRLALLALSLAALTYCSKDKPNQPDSDKEAKKTEKIQVVTSSVGKATINSVNFGDIEILVKNESDEPIPGAKIAFLYTGENYAGSAPEYVMVTVFAPNDSLAPILRLIPADNMSPGKLRKTAFSWEFMLKAWEIFSGVTAASQISFDVPSQDLYWINLSPWMKYVGTGTFDQYQNLWRTRLAIFALVSSVGGTWTSLGGTVINMAGLKVLNDYDDFCKSINYTGWPLCYEPGKRYKFFEVYFPGIFPGSDILPKCLFIIGIEVPNNPPNTPKNPYPSDGATNQSINVDLSWTGGDPDGDPVVYDVYFGAGSLPLVADSAHTDTLYDPGTLQYSTTYYWKVVARDNQGGITPGSVWEFTTQNCPDPPTKPCSPNPSNEATNVSINADLSWGCGTSPCGYTVCYDVYFGTTTPPPKVSTCQNGKIYEPGTLEYDNTYYWKIVAKDNHSNSTSGDVWHFTTTSAPSLPKPDLVVRFSWWFTDHPPGDGVCFGATIKNQGDGRAPQEGYQDLLVSLTIVQNGDTLGTLIGPDKTYPRSLSPGDSSRIVIRSCADGPVLWTESGDVIKIFGMVDPYNTIQESNEENNGNTLTFTIP